MSDQPTYVKSDLVSEWTGGENVTFYHPDGTVWVLPVARQLFGDAIVDGTEDDTATVDPKTVTAISTDEERPTSWRICADTLVE